MALKLQTCNAIIDSVEITNDDRGTLTAWVNCSFDGGGCGFGGYALYLPKEYLNHEVNSGYAGHFIWRVMEIAGVEKWSQLKGKTIRVRHEGVGGGIVEIGHIIKNEWFCPSKEFKNER